MIPNYLSGQPSGSRLQGDGMDSDNMSLSSKLKPQSSAVQKHKFLNSSTKTTSVDKTPKPRHVPKEPTKGAVGSNSLRRHSESTNTVGFRTNQINGNQYVDKTSFQTVGGNSTRFYSETQSSVKESKSIGMNKSHTYSGSLRQNAPEKVSLNTDRIVFSLSPAADEDKNDFQQNEDEPAKNDVVIEMGSTMPPEEERQVEGQSGTNEDSVKLQSEFQTIKQQLQQQVKINADLKKLLVAAVGDDLHWKMDALVNTKTQLASEIGGYTEKIENDIEELDRLSIHADMWRSKYMATRVLIDQLASAKEKWEKKWKHGETALQQMMQERQQLHETMVETHRFLKLLRDSFDPVYARKTESIIPNILELSRTNLLLAENVKLKLLGSLPVIAVALDAGIQNGLSPAEKLAYQALIADSDIGLGGSPVNTPGRLSAQSLNHYGRFHPLVKYEGITCNSCRKCRGEIHVV